MQTEAVTTMRIPTGTQKNLRMFVMLLAFFLGGCIAANAQREDDLNVYMMQATIKLQGSNSFGTGFILVRPLKNQPGPPGRITGKAVLITAGHVLEEMQGDQITVILRSRHPESPDTWLRRPYILPIRRNGQRLWTRHPDADVAVMYVGFDVPLFDKVPTVDLLATDEMLRSYEIAPGVELKCLGYPLGAESTAAGFPILRTGNIASYPLLPTATTKTFLMDFRVFKGNSGGPVYFSQPQLRSSLRLGGRAQFIMGLLSQETLLNVQVQEPYESSLKQLQLFIGVVIHASILRQAIEILPPPESPESTAMAVKMSPAP